MLRTGFGVFSDLLPGSIVDLIASNPPYVNTFQGGLLGQAGGLAIAPGVANSAVDATVAANQAFLAGFQNGISSPSLRSRSQPCPMADSARRTSCSGASASNTSSATRGSLRAQYVGTRAVNQPYTVQVNGYQTVCPGCFQPFPYAKPTDPRFAAVTQLATGANSHYNGLQLTAEKRLAHGLEVRANYTWSHCLDTVSNGGFLSFSADGDHFAASRRALRGSTATATTISGTTSTRPMSMSCRSAAGTGFSASWSTAGNSPARSSIIRGAVLGPERAVLRQRERHRAGRRAAIRERGAGRAAL